MKTSHYQRIMTSNRAEQQATAGGRFVVSPQTLPAVISPANAGLQMVPNAGVQQRMLGLVTNRVMAVVPTTTQAGGGGQWSGGGVGGE